MLITKDRLARERMIVSAADEPTASVQLRMLARSIVDRELAEIESETAELERIEQLARREK